MANSSIQIGGKKLPNLSEASVAYYQRMQFVLSNPEDIEPSSRDSLVQNFIQQVTNDNLVTVSLNDATSRILENFITDWSSEETILKLLQSVKSDSILLVSNHKSGSHVLQKILEKVSYFIYQKANSETSTLIEYFGSEFAPCFIEHLIALAFDPYGSHILRVLIQVICGVLQYSSNENDATGLMKKSDYKKFAPPNEFSNLPEIILNQFTRCSRILEAAIDKFASPALISVIEIFHLSHPEFSRKLNSKVIKRITPFSQLIDHERGSFLIQALILTANEKQYSRILNQNLKGSIYKYAVCSYANYVIQTLIANVHTEEHFTDILQELDNSEQIEHILASGHFGVVYQIVELGLRFPTQQKYIKNMLLETFQCQHKPLLFLPLLLLMVPLENASDRIAEDNVIFLPQDRFHLHGSLIAQTLFAYEKTKLFANSLLSSSIEGILKIASDPNGSHVVDKFVSSENIKRKYKIALYSLLEERIVEFACCKYGSRVFDCVWRELDQEWKERFINRISQNELALKSDFFGKFVVRNCKLDLYKRRKSEWYKIVQNTHSRIGMKHRIENSFPLTEEGNRSSKRKRKYNADGDIDNLFDKLN